MKILRQIQLTAIICLLVCLCERTVSAQEQSQKTAPVKKLASFKEKSSYSVGYDLGTTLRQQGMDLDFDRVVQGMLEAHANKEHRLDQEELRAVMTVYYKELEKLEIARWKKLSRENLKKSEEFLQKNRTAKGVVQLESGLQYKILTAGTGETPTIQDRVRVHFRSINLENKEIINTFKAKQPIEFSVGETLRGWGEILQRTKVGSKVIAYIPSALAYGPEGFQSVGPNEMLVIEYELIKIIQPKKTEAKTSTP